MHASTVRMSAVGIVLLLSASTAALAQQQPQVTTNPTVAAAEATHTAVLGRTAAPPPAPAAGAAAPAAGAAAPAAAAPTGPRGMAWFKLDPQNNAVSWTIEFTGITPATAELLCSPAPPEGGAAAPPRDAAANTLDLADGGRVTSPLQGDMAGVDATLFTALETGRCMLILDVGPGPGSIRGVVTPVPPPAAAAP